MPFFKRMSVVVTIVLTAIVTTAFPSAAGPVDLGPTGGSIQSSICSSSTHWEGQNLYDVTAANRWPAGSVKHCVFRYKLADSDPSAKYFLVYAYSDYDLNRGDKSMDADGWIYIKSSQAAASGVYDATNSYVSTHSCMYDHALGVSALGVSATVNAKTCEDFRVNRTFSDENGAGWNAPKVGGVPEFGTAYLIKIPQSATTTFTVTFWKPNFDHTWNGSQWVESGGYTKWETIL